MSYWQICQYKEIKNADFGSLGQSTSLNILLDRISLMVAFRKEIFILFKINVKKGMYVC